MEIVCWCMVYSGVGLALSGEGSSLFLIGLRSSDGVTIKIAYELDVLLHQPASHPFFSQLVG